MRRRRGPRRPPVVARDGDLVVDARVRARLLGVNLLDLDARVVVGTARGEPAVDETATRRVTPARSRPADGEVEGPPGRPALSRAVRLLDEGGSALDDARLIRRRARARAASDSAASASRDTHR